MQRVFFETSEGRFAAVVTERAKGGAHRGSVLYLHGFPDQPETASALFDALATRGHRVIAPFLRGYAPSPIEGPYALEQLTRDALALWERACGDEPALVLGHDWGAVIAYALCASEPARVRAAVTMAVPHPLRFLRALATRAQLGRSWYMGLLQLPGAALALRAMDHRLVDTLWRDWSPGYALPARERALLHHCLRESSAAPIEYYRAMARPLGPSLRRLRGPLSATITVPTLHLQGADDGCIGAEAITECERYFAGPYAQRVLPGVGHFVPHEAPETVAAMASEWFARG